MTLKPRLNISPEMVKRGYKGDPMSGAEQEATEGRDWPIRGK